MILSEQMSSSSYDVSEEAFLGSFLALLAINIEEKINGHL